MTTLQNDLTYSISPEYLDQFIHLASKAPYIAVDTESNGEEIRDGRGFCQGLSIAVPAPGMGPLSEYFGFRHLRDNLPQHYLFKLKDLIENHPALIFHNAKYDLVSLATLGIHAEGKFYDTMIMAHLLDENGPNTGKSLDSLGKFYLNDEGKKKSKAFKAAIGILGWAGTPPATMREYAAYDTDLTLRLFEHLKPKWEAEELEDMWEHKQQIIRLVAKMECTGVLVDLELCKRELETGINRMAEIAKELGYDKLGPKALNDLLIEKLKLPVVKRSEKTGKPSFDKFAMEEYDVMLEASKNPTADLVAEYRGWQKATSSYYKAYIEKVSPDGRLRPNFHFHRTTTGRLSCSDPNLQQIPRTSDKPWNGNLKSALVPTPGYRLWEADYSQLELRLATAYADQKILKEIFNEGRDVFTEMSEELGIPRQDCKTLTYTIQYGGGIKRIKDVFGVSEERAAELRDEIFFGKYPEFKKINSMAQSRCKAQGYIKLWSGRRRHFANPREDAHKAFNSVIQGGGADIVERSMVRAYKAIGDTDDCRLLLQVHDSIVFEVKEGLEEKYHPIIREAMTNIEPDFGVKFAVDIHEWGKK